jgi:hypothetical protein
MAKGLVPSRNGGMTVANWVVSANREHDRQVRAGEICCTCAAPFGVFSKNYGKVVRPTNVARFHGSCETCAADFE